MTPSIILSAAPDRLPIGALLALAMTGFICIVTETLPAGLLPLISEGLAISPSMAGQMVTAYALGSVLAEKRRQERSESLSPRSQPEHGRLQDQCRDGRAF